MNHRPNPMRHRHTRAFAGLTVAGALVASAGLAGLGPLGASASSHREAPAVSGIPQYDTTDVYAFRAPDQPWQVSFVVNWLPFEEPAGGPNFYTFAEDARYNLKIDNNGDNKADIVYRWFFDTKYRNGGNSFLINNGPVESLDDENLLVYQTYDLIRQSRQGGRKVRQKILDDAPVAPSRVGDASMPDYQALREEAVVKAKGKDVSPTRAFAGQAEDPFFLDLRVFDLLYGGDFSETGDDTLAGFNVNSVALSVQRKDLAKRGAPRRNPVIGVWSTTEQRDMKGKFRQVSRLGNPLVNEVVIPIKDKDRFNRSNPLGDGRFAKYVTEPELPKLIETIYGIEAPEEPRDDLVSVFLTGIEDLNQPDRVKAGEQLRLNMSTRVAEDPNRLGVIGGDTQGYPNGRRLADDVVDISLQVVEGELVGNPNDLSDGVDANDANFSDTFPFVALPVSGSNPDPHPSSTSGASPSAASGLSDSAVAPASALALGVIAMGVGAVGVGRRSRRRTAA